MSTALGPQAVKASVSVGPAPRRGLDVDLPAELLHEPCSGRVDEGGASNCPPDAPVRMPFRRMA
jgi:hypothetical protein